MANETQIIGVSGDASENPLRDLEPRQKVELMNSASGLIGDLLIYSDELDDIKKRYDETASLVKSQMKKFGIASFKLANGRSVCFVQAEKKSVDNGKAIQFLTDNGILGNYQELDEARFKQDFPDHPAVKKSVSEFIRINQWKK